MSERDDNIKRVVAEVLAEQGRLYPNDIDTVVLKAIAAILTSFGIDDDDRAELRADFQHLRRWRKAAEQAHNYTFKVLITILVSGLLGALWLGIKASVGK